MITLRIYSNCIEKKNYHQAARIWCWF